MNIVTVNEVRQDTHVIKAERQSFRFQDVQSGLYNSQSETRKTS